jgi:acyl carrier protein
MDQSREIIEIIANYKGLSADEVTPERTFEDLGIDSLDAIDIVYEVEEKYGIDVPQDALDLNTAQTVADLLKVVEKVRANGAAPDAPTDASAG